MKLILEFDLNQQSEVEEFKRVQNSLPMALALLKITKLKMSQRMIKEINDILDEHKINLEDIVS
jgi:hypothetical protein